MSGERSVRACVFVFLSVTVLGSSSNVCAGAGDDPFADQVIWYVPGVGGVPAYDLPHSALGMPGRTSGQCFGGFDVITPFSPAYCPQDIVSIGAGGELILKFNTPITDDPNNLYGIDLIVFGNAGFDDLAYPSGVVNGLFSEGGLIEVSADGMNWEPVRGLEADGLWPTTGYVDVEPYAHEVGRAPSDFTRPMDPALTMSHVMGLSHAAVLQKYRGSGGGTGIDLASTGLPAISYVRISLPAEARFISPEIDAVADVAPRMPGDVNLDGLVNIDDLVALITAWGPTVPGGPPADFDNNHVVDIDDLVTLITHWTTP